jgi:biotin transport system substrate-specific component
MTITAEQNTLHAPLIDRVWSAGGARNVILAIAGVVLLTISAKISVPFIPVPMTLQSLAVLLIGAAYGWRLGVVTVGFYLLQGLMGLPVFATTPPAVAGPLYFVGPTGGFLIGFVLAAAIVGYAVEKGAARSIVLLSAAMLLAQAVLYALGTLWLAYFAQLSSGSTGTGMARAWSLMLTFMPGDALKTGIAIALTLVFAKATKAAKLKV